MADGSSSNPPTGLLAYPLPLENEEKDITLIREIRCCYLCYRGRGPLRGVLFQFLVVFRGFLWNYLHKSLKLKFDSHKEKDEVLSSFALQFEKFEM